MANTTSLKDSIKNTADEVKIKSTHYLLGAASLVAALAWNDAMKDSANYIYPLPKDNIKFKLVYAIIITIIITFNVGVKKGLVSR